MTFDDFCFYFVNLAVCHMVNLSIFSLQKRWFSTEMEEEWASPHRCGGCINNKETFLNNPQVDVFRVSFKNAAMVPIIFPIIPTESTELTPRTITSLSKFIRAKLGAFALGIIAVLVSFL